MLLYKNIEVPPNLITFYAMQMIGLYKDPKGDDIFKDNTITNPNLSLSNELDQRNGDEVPTLRRRIKEMEDKLKEKDVCRVFW